MTPLMVASLGSSPLAGTLGAPPTSRWTSAVCAALAVDLVAAGAIRADAADRRDHDQLVREHLRAVAEEVEQRDRARADACRAEARLAAIETDARGPRGARPPHPGRGPVQPTPAATSPTDPQSPTGPTSAAILGDVAGELRCACGRGYPSQHALAGHRRWCGVAAAQGGRWQPPASPASVANVGG